jgi:hypothetical protein
MPKFDLILPLLSLPVRLITSLQIDVSVGTTCFNSHILALKFYDRTILNIVYWYKII